MSAKEILRLTEWLKSRGKTEEEIAECLRYISTGKLTAEPQK